MWTNFDQYASLYDAWFLENENVLLSELRLVAMTLANAGRILSVGCGSGLFEKLLDKEFGIKITNGIEPSKEMAAIATARGIDVTICSAEDADFGKQDYDTILFNGTPSYIDDLDSVVRKAYEALPEGGRIVLIDVPKESSYGLLYNLAMTLGTWDHPLLEGCKPRDPYPIQLVKAAHWRTTASKLEIVKACGFKDITTAQTLTTHPLVSDAAAEMPQQGCDKGDYVAVIAYK